MGIAPRPTVALAIGGPITRAALPALCARVCELLDRSGAGILLCDVRGVAADAVSVDALARVEVAANRHGCRIALRHASRELRDLVAFMGLGDVLPSEP